MKSITTQGENKMESKNGKHFFGLTKVGAKGQIVIPVGARKIFNIKSGDELLILADENQGIAIVKPELTKQVLDSILKGDKNVRD